MRGTASAILAALALAITLLASPAEARREWQAFGGSGDASVPIECPAGQVMVGFEGRTGSWINQMRILCAPLTGPYSTGPAQPVGQYFGGRPGGAPNRATCENNAVMSQINFQLTGNKGRVAALTISCVSETGAITTHDFSYGSHDLEGCNHAGVGCDPGEHQRVQTCPQESLVGLRVNSGQDVNALGLICDRRDAPPAIVPVKPIKPTSRAPVGQAPTAAAAPAGPPTALRQTVTGPWKLAFTGGGTYVFQIIASGTGVSPFGRDELPVGIQGTFTELGGAADSGGGFGGQMDAGRQILVQYGRKNGTAGACQLLYATDAKSIIGTCSEKDGETYKVTGSRASAADVAAAQQVPAPAAAPAPAARGQAVTVVQAVDYYAAAGGNGEAAGSLEAGTSGVTLIEPCKGSWCHVKWPGHEGWVYNADDYRSLKF